MTEPHTCAPQIEQIDRKTAARMFTHLGRKRQAQEALAGKHDNNRFWPLVPALARYRARFEQLAHQGVDLLEQDALNAAADYLDQRSITAYGEQDWIAPGLREGFRYSEPRVRAFLLHHRLLAARVLGPLTPAGSKANTEASLPIGPRVTKG